MAYVENMTYNMPHAILDLTDGKCPDKNDRILISG